MSDAVDPRDAFAVLELAPRFAVDAAQLEERYFALSRQAHPDRLATAPAAERVAALGRARAINDAYQLLRKPVSRAEHLLARRGVVIGANERLDPERLQEILELREELSEARHGGLLDKVAVLQKEMRQQRAALVDALGPAFAELEAVATPDPQVLARIKGALIALRYVDRYLEECDAALEDDA